MDNDLVTAGINDDYVGFAPDLGALESGATSSAPPPEPTADDQTEAAQSTSDGSSSGGGGSINPYALMFWCYSG